MAQVLSTVLKKRSLACTAPPFPFRLPRTQLISFDADARLLQLVITYPPSPVLFWIDMNKYCNWTGSESWESRVVRGFHLLVNEVPHC
jgi:hypothetical protein